ncbi:phosphate/phosphite/phosphonate ABC transporter substrate-binding protein [Phaeobacter inhibens]|uniref:phosphate/phosphite/phosphonate ABC transporter substrate-binding protein n=1 Tax=Phaeobacter inhibens TaxID=221822 RepID=UPI000C9AA16E|nr:PhnD/SsuA/transferrin family substrate-binding protein [Phaeobacter inhibens]AUQ62116.1 ABC-type phosphate/phosphonate transport system, periplasmic component [Phaeobacter inhibens]AUQ82090.1 ABC-type phosphate/phosphonate transport system, periplasmic component [Phaeobacter inhibens]MDO6755425.1 PhnD/SsuA/transferrin family substrate-binding protein [Phaeobacter inhibens]
MIASLAMYDRPETAPALDALWQAIRHELTAASIDAPETLTRGGDLWSIWSDSKLLLAQTCGLPYRTRLYEQVNLVTTLDHGVADCPPGHYNSVFIAHRNRAGNSLQAIAGGSFAYNEALSQSGWAAPMLHLRDLSLLPGSLFQSGSHIASARAVAEGTADFAALDAVSWTLMQEHDYWAKDLIEVARTPSTPGLPLITASTRDPAPLRTAVAQAVATLDDEHRKALHLKGVCEISPGAYLAVPTPLGPVLTEQSIRQQAAG